MLHHRQNAPGWHRCKQSAMPRLRIVAPAAIPGKASTTDRLVMPRAPPHRTGNPPLGQPGHVLEWIASFIPCLLMTTSLMVTSTPSALARPSSAFISTPGMAVQARTPMFTTTEGSYMPGMAMSPDVGRPQAEAVGPGVVVVRTCQPIPPLDRPSAYDLGGYTHRSATQSPTAQTLIDQGLLLAYNFNQLEARKAFAAALEVDPNSIMAYWGLAYAQGPFMNKVAAPPPADNSYPVFTDKELSDGRQALDKGLALAEQQILETKLARLLGKEEEARIRMLERDRAYLLALAPVFQHDSPYGPGWLRANNGFALSMEAWAADHPDDADAFAFAAEAWANTQPWDFWQAADPSLPKGLTPHILDLLGQALAIDPTHPLAAHLLIHITEASTAANAATALPAADMLGARYASFGHMVHMPSHTYLRVGRWHDALIANERALAVDLAHADACLDPDMPSHNAAMGVYAAVTAAEQEPALRLAADLTAFPSTFGASYMSEGRDRLLLPLARLRFALWPQLAPLTAQDLDQSRDGVMLPPNALPFEQAMYHYIDTMRLAARAVGKTEGGSTAAADSAREALSQLQAVVLSLPDDTVTLPGQGLGVYSLAFKLVASQAEQVAQARLAVLAGDWDAAAQLLARAVATEGSGGYTEPPRVSQPQGECLGWVLLKSGQLPQAAAAYLKVLEQYPRSAWALTGLRDVHRAVEEARSTGQAPDLPADTPSQAQVEALLTQLKEESQGQAVDLPSSCPAFSVPDAISMVASGEAMGMSA